MSQSNVEIVLASQEDFNRRGRVDPDLWHEDAILTGPEGWPERGPFQGKPEVVRQFDRLIEDLSDHTIEDVHVIGHDGDWVAITFRWHTRGKGSGLEDATEVAVAFRLREGRFAEGHYRWTPEQALDAAGLSSQ